MSADRPSTNTVPYPEFKRLARIRELCQERLLLNPMMGDRNRAAFRDIVALVEQEIDARGVEWDEALARERDRNRRPTHEDVR